MESKENINFIFQLNNKNRSGNFFVLFIVGGLLLSAVAITCVAITEYVFLIVVSIISILYIIFLNIIRPSFFEILVTDKLLQINYYSVASTFRSYQSVEIPIHELADFSLTKKFSGLKSTLTLSVKSKYGIADYPPISLSLLSKNEKGQVVLVLNEILKSNNPS